MKKFYCLLLTLLPCAGFCYDYPSVNHCVEAGKFLFKEAQIERAQQVFLDCYSMSPSNTDVLISLGGIYLIQNNLQAAKSFFEKAADLLPKTSPYNAYTYSRLGDIYFKEGDFKTAKKNYVRALRFNYGNVNSIIGYAVILEYDGDTLGAAKTYKTALAVEPYNTIARENYRRLEPLIFDGEEILEALKARQALPREQTNITPQDAALFYKIHRAEQSMGVEYLQDKYKHNPPAGMIIEAGTGTAELRFMLSLRGYNEVMRIMSLDAFKYFNEAGIAPVSIYKLRDVNGLAVFDAKHILTEEGIAVYTKALAGAKTFLLPGEPVPAAAKEADARVKKLLSDGYVEITPKEFQYLVEKTLCSETTMVKRLLLKVINTPKLRRFVKKAEDLRFEGILYYYAMEYRTLMNPNQPRQKAYSNFFGDKAATSQFVCDKKGNIKAPSY